MSTERGSYRFLMGLAADVATPSPVVRKIRAFAGLPNGWSHGDGVPVAHEAIQIAERFIDVASLLQLKVDVFPGVNGDCSVTFYEGTKTVEVVVRPENLQTFGLHVERGLGFQFLVDVDKDDATVSEALDHIRGLVPIAWKSSAFCPSVSSTQERVDFRTSSSSNLLAWA